YYEIKGRFIEDDTASGRSKNSRLPDLASSAGLDKYLEYGAARSPALKAAFDDWKASLERIAQARSLPNPQLRYGYFVQAVETRAGPQRNRFGLSQGIPWPEKLILSGDVAFLQSQALRKRFEERRRELFHSIKLAYYDLFFIEQSIEVTKQTVSLARYYERIALIRYRASGGKHPDVIRAQIELGRLEDRTKSLSDLKLLQITKFNALLNRPLSLPLSPPKTLQDPYKWPKAELLFQSLRKENSELAALNFEIARQEKSVERANKDYYPDLILGVDYIDTGSSIQSGTRDSGKDPVVLNFGISLPIWRSKYAAGVREARARSRSLQNRKQATLRRLEAALHQALFNLRDARRKIDLYKNSLIPKAEQAQRGTATAFESGKSDFLSLIDVARSLLEFNLNYQKALTDQAKANANIERLIGAQTEEKP
ncbi:MAG: TolC family protein, partial [Planctomycetota bacterium]|nr:TolC family protein [Planctomycetota bacterium]